ncbi:late embryogenesis abundant protein (LEA) family protein [Tasmannia lanceolata]|uniref:late embryogenesis abundant protein (LEA) family protein n=1 Tax=Tasmannia lanceolata TaxID=3420 RepID=UPI0040646651
MSNSQQLYKGGKARGHAQEKTDEWIESAKGTANAAADKVADAAQSTQDNAQQKKDETAGFFQQTGEQMMNMAQGAVDSVKNTLGVGDQNTRK